MRALVRMASLAVLLGCAALLAEPAGLAWLRRSSGSALAADEIAPRADVQEAIGKVARATDAADLDRALAELRAVSAPDHSDLVPQLAIYLLSARGEREGMAPAIIVDRLEITHDEIVRAVTPHLATSNEALRAQLENLLGAD